jgi:hypothetical protein
MFQTLFSKRERPYTGVELRPHFLLTELGLKGSGIAAFIGPCQVKTEHLVDWEDRLANDHIAAGMMVHFLGEFFGISLREGVLLQRLLSSMVQESIPNAHRQGDDIFVAGRKLSVSIVTASPVSQLLHLGINIDPVGAPVPAIGLKELKIDPQPWAEALLERISSEWTDIEWACTKVRPVL